MHKKTANRELFNDGMCTVCKTEKRAITADICSFRFGLRTVGITRFYQAKIAESSIDRLISVPFNRFINAKSIILINEVQYEVKQIQEKYDTEPPSMYLTLQRAIPVYEDRRNKSNESN